MFKSGVFLTKFPLIFFFHLNLFQHQQALHFGVLNYEKQHKEGTCKVSGRWVIFSAFYADFCLCPKSVIITTLKVIFLLKSMTTLNLHHIFDVNLVLALILRKKNENLSF